MRATPLLDVSRGVVRHTTRVFVRQKLRQAKDSGQKEAAALFEVCATSRIDLNFMLSVTFV